MLILKNKRRAMRVYNLDSPFFVKNQNETPFGKPCVLTFLALEKKEVDDAVKSCAEIQSALAIGDLRVLTPQTPRVKESPVSKDSVAKTSKSVKRSVSEDSQT